MKFLFSTLLLIISLIAPTLAQNFGSLSEEKQNLFGAAEKLNSFGAVSETDVRPFEMLAIGDSVMWGQGLLEKDKFTYRVKNWLETDVFKGNRLVNLHVMAHSGAAITEKPDGNFDPLKYYNGEINLWTPSITRQAMDAFNCYNQPTNLPDKCYQAPSERLSYYKGNPVTPENVDLILVDGCINDMTPIKLFDAFFSKDKIRAAARQYCDGEMTILLKELVKRFPNARIIVTGYFPLISKESDSTAVVAAVLNAFGRNPFSDVALKALGKLDTPTLKQTHFIRNYLAKRSAIWYEESNESLRNAVDKTNKLPELKTVSRDLPARVFFAKVTFGAENTYGAQNTFLWKLIDKTRTNDPLFEARAEICQALKLEGANRLERFVCHRAGLFHPNIKGADAYYKAIISKLEQIIINK